MNLLNFSKISTQNDCFLSTASGSGQSKKKAKHAAAKAVLDIIIHGPGLNQNNGTDGTAIAQATQQTTELWVWRHLSMALVSTKTMLLADQPKLGPLGRTVICEFDVFVAQIGDIYTSIAH